jgi:hypothetical protein
MSGESRGSPLPRVVLAIVLAAIMASSCGAPLMKLPPGPGSPAPDTATAVIEATSTCLAVSSISAEMAVSGSVGRRALRARLLIGLAAPASARLEAFAYGQRMFIFVARGTDATLLLTRDGRVLAHGRSDAVLEAVTGVPLGASDLRSAVLGCAVGPDSAGGRRLGADWRVVPDGRDELYLHRDPPAAPWRLVSVVHRDPGHPEWRAEYRGFEGNVARAIRFVSSEPGRFDLRLTLAQVELNPKLDPAAFEVTVPASAEPMTIEELRQNGPLAGANASGGDGR